MSRSNRIIRRSGTALRVFLETESAGGYALLTAVVIALAWSNLAGGYRDFWAQVVGIAGIEKDLQHWINDGLMTVFFFVVGLEIKREVIAGELRDRRIASLPFLAAIGGMAVPAMIYLAINPSGQGMRGWAIPMATDIAFVVGGLVLLGSRVPDGLRVFLLALAIIDDIGAIAVIAIFYAGGVHPTIIGVVLGFLVPVRPLAGREIHEWIQRVLHPVSSFVVVPIFALANAGVVLSGSMIKDAFASRVVLGIIAGLVIGKTVGIFGASVLGERLRIGRRPSGVRWRHMLGASALAGIGFTVSLFIAGLAFDDPRTVDQARIGVLAGSTLGAVIGSTVLALSKPKRPR